MARSLARPRMVRAAVAALCAAAASAGGARIAMQRPRVERERPAAPCHGADAARSALAARVRGDVDRRARKLPARARSRVARAILEETARARLDPRVVLAVIQVESSYDPQAVSPAGAIGLMQLLGPTMREEAARSRLASGDPRDPVANVRAGIRYLSRLAAAFDDLELALLAYNAGPGRIRRHLRSGAVPDRLLVYPRRVQAELDRISARWGHPAPRLAARPARRPSMLAAHAAARGEVLAAAAPSLRPGKAAAPGRLFEPPAVAVAPYRPARRPAVRLARRRRRPPRRPPHRPARRPPTGARTPPPWG